MLFRSAVRVVYAAAVGRKSPRRILYRCKFPFIHAVDAMRFAASLFTLVYVY